MRHLWTGSSGRHHLVTRARRIAAVALLAASLVATAGAAHAGPRLAALAGDHEGHGRAASYLQTNLVSDIPGMAAVTDPHLVNPWGISFSPTSPFWISDNGTGVSTLYTTTGGIVPLVVTIPPPAGSPAGTLAAPTGTVFNPTSGFVVTQKGVSGKSIFLFATEDGTISGWNPTVNRTNAILAVDNSASGPGAVYKGLALATTAAGSFLYAANFRAGTIDVFDTAFAPAHLDGSFADRAIPAGFAPFNIQLLAGHLYVTYARQNDARHDDVAGPGNGFVDVFDTEGHLERRLVSGGPLNSPWGLALAPDGQGSVSDRLLVGNFGDGHISIFDPRTGTYHGQLTDPRGTTLAIPGLWGLAFGNGGSGGDPHVLYFTAGIGGEAHGLFGSLTKVSGDEGDDNQQEAGD